MTITQKVYCMQGNDFGYLHAFGPLDPNAPSAPDIDGPSSGKPGTEYEYTFKSTSPVGRYIYYYIEWGDGKKKNWFGPHSSGTEVTKNHKWIRGRTFVIRAKAKDTYDAESEWAEFEVEIPRNKAINNLLFLRFLERFPLLERLLSLIRVM